MATSALASAARARLLIRICRPPSNGRLPLRCRSASEGLGGRGDPVDAAACREHVQLAGRVLTEREHIAETHVQAPAGLPGAGAVRVGKAPHPAGAVVGVEVLPDERRRACAAVDKAAGDRAAVRVAVLDHRLHEARAAAGSGVEAVQPLHDPPAVVQPSLSRRRDAHLFPKVLTHVCDVEEPRHPVEREAPRIPEAERPALGRAAARRERIAGGNGVRVAVVRVVPKRLAEQRVGFRRAVLRVAPRAPVAHADVEHPVGPERHEPAVVVRMRLCDEEDQLRRGDVGNIGIRADRVAFDPRVAVVVGVVDVEVSVRGVARVERHAQQPPLASCAHGAGDVQERSRGELPVLHDPDPPLLLDNEESRIPCRRRQVQWTAEPARDELQLEGPGFTGQGRSTGHVAQTGGERAPEDGSGFHLGPNTIAPLKFRTVTWAPPVPVENRSSCPALAGRRRGWLAPSVLVIVPPIVSASKSATVLAGTRTSMVPLWLSTSTTPPRPSSPSKRTSPVTDSNLPRCTPVPPRCHPAARTRMRPLNVDAPRSWLAPRSRMSPLTVFTPARAVPPATSTLPSIVSAVTSWRVPSTWMLPPWLLRSNVPSTPSTWMLAVADLTHTVAPRGTRTSMSAPVPTAPSIPSFRTCASPAA